MNSFKIDLLNKKVLVLGLSKSGVAAARLLIKLGANVFLSEFREEKTEDFESIRELYELGIAIEMGGHSDEFIKNTEFVVTSPAISPKSPIMQRLNDENIKVISEIELAFLSSNSPFIAITGTNGKTTTTALTAHIFNSKYKSEACGNFGVPPCDLIENDLDYFVCECSSYQLEMSPTFKPQIAVWTNFTPDHIDWHGGIKNYFEAKAKIFKLSQCADFVVLNANDEKLVELAKYATGEVFFFGRDLGGNCSFIKDDSIFYKRNGDVEKIITLADCPLIGQHNYENIMCASICARLVGVSADKIREAIMSFEVPEHRFEKFANIKGIDFYNDSKATNPEASIVAVKSFTQGQKVVLIAGGRDKNTDLSEFAEVCKKHIDTVVLIGEASERFEREFKSLGFKKILLANSLQNAVDLSIELKPNAILLSPACASFDMFNSYEHRGWEFKNYVKSIT